MNQVTETAETNKIVDDIQINHSKPGNTNCKNYQKSLMIGKSSERSRAWDEGEMNWTTRLPWLWLQY